MRAVAIAAALLLMACGPLPNPQLCQRGPSPDQIHGHGAADLVETLHAQAEACVIHSAYDLAPSGDPVEDVASAILLACKARIDAYNLMVTPAGDYFHADARAMRRSMHDKAFETVVRARAGHCR